MILIFNDIAGSEILLILVFVLVFFGAKSIPTLARTFGRTIRQIKDATNDIQTEIKKSGVDIKKDLNLKGIIDDTVQEVQKPLDQMMTDLDSTIKYEPKSQNSHIPPIQSKTEEVKPSTIEMKKEESESTEETSQVTKDINPKK